MTNLSFSKHGSHDRPILGAVRDAKLHYTGSERRCQGLADAFHLRYWSRKSASIIVS